MNNVGFSLVNGTGVSVNIEEGAKWLRRAADGGQPNAMHTLGSLYAQGKGVLSDLARAYFWVQLAIKNYAPSEEHRPGAVGMSKIIAARLAPAQIERLDAEVEAWKPAPAAPTT